MVGLGVLTSCIPVNPPAPVVPNATTGRAGVINRAQSWVDAAVLYTQGVNFFGVAAGYRSDCSGYVSYALGMSGPGIDTVALANPFVSTRIAKLGLRPGDFLDKGFAGGNGHVVLFAGWTSSLHTSYWGYEELSSGRPATLHQIPYPYFPNDDPNDFQPYRYNFIASA
jgi:NlpC/P60 family